MAIALDLIISNADIVTMDPRHPRAGRVGVLNGRIVGLDDDLDGVTAADTYDAGGACLLPGFVDAHTHLELTGQYLAAVQLAGCHSVDAALAAIATVAATRPADAWIEVSGYEHHAIGRHLTAVELHAAAGGRRVWVRQLSSHASVVSTAVLEAAADGPHAHLLANPRIAGGVLEELEQNLVRSQRLPYSQDELADVTALAAEQARRQGITYCIEAGNGGEVGSLSTVDGAVFQRLLETGRLPVRVQLMPSHDVLRDMRTHPSDGFGRGIDLGLRTGFGSDLLHLGAQKVVLDGGMQVGTARMSRPYAATGTAGTWRKDVDEMITAIVDGHRAGWQLAVHAIGDLAMDVAIGAFDRAQQEYPRSDARHRIEHGGAIRDDQLADLGRLGLAIVTQPSFIYHYGDQYHQLVGPDRTDWLYRGRTLIDNGAVLVGSTDRPLWGDPLRAIQTMAQRRTNSGREQSPAERISVYEALQAFTVNAAWVARREDRLGRVANGYLADFCLLDRNPLQTPVPEIADIEVLATVLDGSMHLVDDRTRATVPA